MLARPRLWPRGTATVVVVCVLSMSGPLSSAHAQTTETAEARAYFDEGNRLFARSRRTGGSQREELLERALAEYVRSLSVFRSPNALFNAAVVSAELGRPSEAHAYFDEYIAHPNVSEGERDEARARRSALRARLVLARVESEPPGARVSVDGSDAPLGRTPLAAALPPGTTILRVTLDGHEPTRLEVSGEAGETASLRVTLLPSPPSEPTPEEIPAAEPGAEASPPTEPAPTPHVPLAPSLEPEPSPSPRTTADALPSLAPGRALLVTGGLLGLGALGLWIHSERLNARHATLSTGEEPLETRVARARELDRRIARTNAGGRALVGLAAVTGSVGLVLAVRARRRRSRVGLTWTLGPSSLALHGRFGASP